MTYQEWANEYWDTAQRIQEKIMELKAESETVPPSALQSIHRRIDILYGMYLDCRHTAENLQIRKGEIG